MPTSLQIPSPCKVNLLLNILGKRPNGFHELETVMHPVNYCDRLELTRAANGIQLTCSDSMLPTDSRNLVYRAAEIFLKSIRRSDGIQIHLEKRIPLAAGLGSGSGNAAMTLLGLNELFGNPFTVTQLHEFASGLGSDVPYFLYNKPALATGRGEKVASFEPFAAMRGSFFVLIHPGFGISTAWAYQNLARFPVALNGQKGRAQKLIAFLQKEDLSIAAKEFYNSLEAPALEKFPVLALYQEFFRENGAAAALMSGSGSTTFALVNSRKKAEEILEKFKGKFGATCWTAIVPARN